MARDTHVSLIVWISDTHFQGHTDLQSLVKCLERRGVASGLVCSFAMHWIASLRLYIQSSRVRCTCPIYAGNMFYCNLGQRGSGERAQPGCRCVEAEFWGPDWQAWGHQRSPSWRTKANQLYPVKESATINAADGGNLDQLYHQTAQSTKCTCHNCHAAKVHGQTGRNSAHWTWYLCFWSLNIIIIHKRQVL